MSLQFEDSISTGVWQRSDFPDDFNSNSMQLNPQCAKQLKTYAQDLSTTLNIPEKGLLEFIETGDIYHMLVNVKASLLKYEIQNNVNKSTALQDTLMSKDFETTLHNRLLACVLSPNITAYVTDTQQHIMDFIFEHQDIFKIPAGVFDDTELNTCLCSTVSRLLATIHSHLKTQLTLSIIKKTSIIEVTKTLARTSSGMELDTSHWNRMAFLHRCLRIFFIGTGDLKGILLNICFTPCLLPMLKMMENDFAEESTTAAPEGAHSATIRYGTPDLSPPADGEKGADTGADNVPDENNDEIDELGEGDSGFGLKDKLMRFNNNKFWNYVDYMLNILCEIARKNSSTKEEYEQGVTNIMVQIFQADLLDCPGSRKVSRLTAVNPQ